MPLREIQKRVQKMSKRLNLEETGALLLAAQKLILSCHVSPDCDTLGSALGLKLFLEKQGKEVLLLVDDVVNNSFSFLPGIDTVVRPQEGEKYTADIHVVIDASSWDRIGICNQVIKADKLMNIDHHISNTEFAEYLYLDAQAAAVGEIMVDLFKANGWEMDKAMADNFYTAISTDCGSFRYSNTSPKTMRNAAGLLELGVNPNDINEQLGLNSVATMQLLAKVLPTLGFAYEGRVAYITLSNELYNKEVSTETFVNYVRYIEGVDIGFFIKEVEPGKTRVSMRSCKTDVARIAIKFDGGGHMRAAGCTIMKPLQEALAEVLKAIGEIME